MINILPFLFILKTSIPPCVACNVFMNVHSDYSRPPLSGWVVSIVPPANAFSRDTIQETYNRDPSLWTLFLSIQKYFSLSPSIAYHRLNQSYITRGWPCAAKRTSLLGLGALTRRRKSRYAFYFGCQIQTGRSCSWSSNGSGVSLRSVVISMGSLRCAGVTQNGMRNWKDKYDGLDDRGSSDSRSQCWN